MPLKRERKFTAVAGELGVLADFLVASLLVELTSRAFSFALFSCRLSGTFPLCDGTHQKHNEATGDNVGPVS